ncbi:MAG: deaminase [Candidatus Sulfotelmatobacter sp.]
MAKSDLKHMNDAINLAMQCAPIADRIPLVGAVIAVGPTLIGKGRRGTGEVGDDDHAEKTALNTVVHRTQLPDATLYTTLEPCTREVRSDPLNACTELISQAEIKKVFIGILDPNQGVRGKGLWELQNRGVDVELFPPELAKRIRAINAKFIKEQQTLGIRITNVQNGQTIRTEPGDVFELKGTFLNAPGPDVFALANIGGQWWPQPYSLSTDASHNTWSVKVHVGSYKPHKLVIVRANELGMALFNYYRKITARNWERDRALRDYVRSLEGSDEYRQTVVDRLKVGPLYPGIEMANLPKGIERQDSVDVNIETPPKQ